MATIRVPSALVPRRWRDITQRILGGDDVIVEHYREPAWKITAVGQHSNARGVLLYGYKLRTPDESTEAHLTATWGRQNAHDEPGIQVWTHDFYQNTKETKSLAGGGIKIGLQRTNLCTEFLLVAKVIPAPAGAAVPVDFDIPTGTNERLAEVLREFKAESSDAFARWWFLPDPLG